MSLPLFKDVDKVAKDMFEDDFGVTKHTVKVKADAPNGVGLTTTTDILPSGTLASKLAFKWSHPSGLALDKVELVGSNKPTVEVSHSGLLKGLKAEVKSSAAVCANVGATYRHEFATVAADANVCGGSHHLNTSVLAGKNGFMLGGSGTFGCDNDKECRCDVIDWKAVVAYRSPTLPLYFDVKGLKMLNAFNTTVHYKPLDNLSLAASVDYTPNNKDIKVTTAVAHAMKNADAVLKLKLNNDGIAAISVKKDFREQRLSVVAATEVNLAKASTDGLNLKYGVCATLG